MSYATAVLRAQEEQIQEVLPDRLTAGDWIGAGAIVLGTVLLGRLVQALIARALRNGDAERSMADLLSRIARNVIILGGVVYALGMLDVRIAPLLGAIGIGGLALAFAAQSILENVFASVVLRTRQSFRRGDQICVLEYEGTVQDVNMRTVVLRSYDGERVLLPCAEVLRSPILNHTANGLRSSTLHVQVAYDADLRDARQAVRRAAESTEGVLRDPAPSAHVESFGESGILFALFFWHAPDNSTMWRVRSELAIEAKDALDEVGIVMPFPQRTLSFLSEERGVATLPRWMSDPSESSTAASVGSRSPGR